MTGDRCSVTKSFQKATQRLKTMYRVYAGKDEEARMAENKEMGQALSIEENFVKLEEVIKRLEGGETSLEEAFAAYSEGMRLVKECNDQIDRVEKQVLKLTEEGTLEPLDAEL